MLSNAFKEFEIQCENDYYVEYFWFPGQKRLGSTLETMTGIAKKEWNTPVNML